MTLPTFSADAIQAWLTAQIDDDERVASACRYKSWTQDGSSIVGDHPTDEIVDWVYDEGGWEHIARHDPARVLREIEAKRRRVARHVPEPWKPGWPGHVCHDFELINVPDGWTGPMTHWCDWCSETQSREEWFYAPWPCPDVIDDAQSYRDAPGFPAELRLP